MATRRITFNIGADIDSTRTTARAVTKEMLFDAIKDELVRAEKGGRAVSLESIYLVLPNDICRNITESTYVVTVAASHRNVFELGSGLRRALYQRAVAAKYEGSGEPNAVLGHYEVFDHNKFVTEDDARMYGYPNMIDDYRRAGTKTAGQELWSFDRRIVALSERVSALEAKLAAKPDAPKVGGRMPGAGSVKFVDEVTIKMPREHAEWLALVCYAGINGRYNPGFSKYLFDALSTSAAALVASLKRRDVGLYSDGTVVGLWPAGSVRSHHKRII